MAFELPTVAELKNAAARGQRITVEDATRIAERESELTGGNTITGGAAATAHSLLMRQMEFDAKAETIARKSPSQITQDDAREIEFAETRAFNRPPGRNSVSAQTQSIVDRNEECGPPS